MVKKFFKNVKAKCKGFSLMELVVTIAIMAVLAAVLAPALIHYVEDSRATKDNHAMTEVVNAVKVALAYDDVYDEIIDDITWKNSCYVDSNSPKNENKELLFVDDNDELYQSYMYTDEERMLDETPYKFHGRMYGATVTFKPNNNHVIEIKDGIYSGEGTDRKISEMNEDNVLYTKIKQVIGNKIELTSATYKNSQYTIFICFGVEAEKTQNEYKVELSDEPIVVYGQWSGTNLLSVEMQDPSLDDTPDFNTSIHDGVIPEGGEYTPLTSMNHITCSQCGYNFSNPSCTMCGNLITGDSCDSCGEPLRCWCGTFDLDSLPDFSNRNEDLTEFPDTPIMGDVYIYGDYAYVYGAYTQNSEPHTFDISSHDYGYGYNSDMNGWRVLIYDPSGSNTLTWHSYFKQKDTYEPFLSSIAGKPVLSAEYMFYGAGAKINSLTLPKGEYKLDGMFYNHGSGTEISQINFMGTVAEWNQIVSRSVPSWYSSLTNYQNMVIRCTDGDVCIYHDSSSFNQTTSSFVNGSYHITQGICARCNQNVSVQESHSGGTATCKQKKVCTKCNGEYGSLADHTGGTATCTTKKICTVCNQAYGSLAAHNYVADNTKPWQYSTTDKHARTGVCVCGAEGKSSTTQNHTYVHTCQSSTCTGCGHTKASMQSGAHTIVNGQCTLCGKTTNAVVIKADRNYVNYEAIGTWSFSDATSVNITVKVQMERDAFDWVNLVYGTSYVNGTTSAKCLTTSGSIGTYSLSSSNVKFASPSNNTSKTYTLTNIPMTSGTVVLKTDTSILYNGATITITPNYD